jgi:predicted RND superfamily exporter protein
VVFILIPLLLAVLLTCAAGVLLKIDFNFANIIVIPLILGIGVDYSIHMIHRFRSPTDSQKNLLKSATSRAVFFSALTTIVSFGSLSFLSHRGTASMGILLTFCTGFMILCSLVLLPALLQLYGRGERARRKAR